MRAKSRIEPGLGDLAGHGNSAAAVFLNVYRDLRVVNNVILAQLRLDGPFRFTATEASYSNITDQGHRDISVGAHAGVPGKIRRPIHCDLHFIPRTEDECRGIGFNTGCFFWGRD